MCVAALEQALHAGSANCLPPATLRHHVLVQPRPLSIFAGLYHSLCLPLICQREAPRLTRLSRHSRIGRDKKWTHRKRQASAAQEEGRCSARPRCGARVRCPPPARAPDRCSARRRRTPPRSATPTRCCSPPARPTRPCNFLGAAKQVPGLAGFTGAKRLCR